MEAAPRVLRDITGGLVVSCQAPVGSPLRDPAIVALIAQAAILGGAVGLRVNGPDDVAAVRAITALPIIGLHKVRGEHRNLITPGVELARGLLKAGADMIAVDGTAEVGALVPDLIPAVIAELGCPVMADIATYDEGIAAHDAGAHVVGTTLSGYTVATMDGIEAPDLALIRRLAERGVPVIAEGRYRSPGQVAAAFEAGALAVVVGGAITDPLSTTQRFAAATPRMSG